jgi:hypothetical protein
MEKKKPKKLMKKSNKSLRIGLNIEYFGLFFSI